MTFSKKLGKNHCQSFIPNALPTMLLLLLHIIRNEPNLECIPTNLFSLRSQSNAHHTTNLTRILFFYNVHSLQYSFSVPHVKCISSLDRIHDGTIFWNLYNLFASIMLQNANTNTDTGKCCRYLNADFENWRPNEEQEKRNAYTYRVYCI